MLKSVIHKLKRKKLVLLCSFISSVVICSTVFYHENIVTPINDQINNIYSKSETYFEIQDRIDRFYNEVFEIFITKSPQTTIQPIQNGPNCKLDSIGVDFDDKFYSKKTLQDCLQLDDQKYQDLKQSHDLMLQLLPKEFPEGFYQGDGIVMVGGGKFSLLALLSIKTLRYKGSKLPVEVFIPQGEEEDEVCEFFATLNAKCISLNDILDEVMIKRMNVKGYQLKSLLIMASSFENVLLLDADNNLIVNVDNIFQVLPFNETGLVTWPDYWKRATSPIFYDIAGVKLGQRVRYSIDSKTPVSLYVTGRENLDTDVPLHDREGAIPDGSTESGQLLINKYKHAGTVLLSFYYNFNGPQYFYPLLGQGTSGEGDKDTFLAAAQILGNPFYQVKKHPGTEGYHRDNSFHGVCMLQADPVMDFFYYNSIPTDSKDVGFAKVNKYVVEKNYFIHAHHPKLDPYDLFKSGVLINDGKHERMYANLPKHGVDFDFELLQFVYMKELFCESDLKFLYFESIRDVSKKQVCQFVNDHYNFLIKSTKEFGSV